MSVYSKSDSLEASVKRTDFGCWGLGWRIVVVEFMTCFACSCSPSRVSAVDIVVDDDEGSGCAEVEEPVNWDTRS